MVTDSHNLRVMNELMAVYNKNYDGDDIKLYPFLSTIDSRGCLSGVSDIALVSAHCVHHFFFLSISMDMYSVPKDRQNKRPQNAKSFILKFRTVSSQHKKSKKSYILYFLFYPSHFFVCQLSTYVLPMSLDFPARVEGFCIYLRGVYRTFNIYYHLTCYHILVSFQVSRKTL